MEETVGSVSKSKKVRTIVRLTEWKGQRYMDIRDFFQPEGGSNWIPTKRGVSVRISNINTLAEIIKRANTNAITRID